MKITSLELSDSAILLILERRVHSNSIGVPSEHETELYILDFLKSKLHSLPVRGFLSFLEEQSLKDKKI